MCYMIRSIEIYIKNMFKNLSLQAKYGLAATATPIIIFAGIYIAWGYASRSLKRNRQVFTRSMSIGVIHGGKPALQRLIDFHKARLDAKIPNKAVKKLKYTLITEKPDFFHLKVRGGCLYFLYANISVKLLLLVDIMVYHFHPSLLFQIIVVH